MKYHLLPDKLLTQVESNPGFWIIHWGSFAMLLLGKGLWRCLSSHPRAGKTAGEIQTRSFPAGMPLGHAEEIPKSRMGLCRSKLHTALSKAQQLCSATCACLLPLALPCTASLLTHR